MSTGTQPSPISDLTTFTTQLDGLCPDQSPNDLSDALRAAFKQRELYDAYVSSLVGDVERIKMLLEVFDKVRSAKLGVSRGLILNTDLRHRPLRLPRTMTRCSSGSDNFVAGRGSYRPPTSFLGNLSKQLSIPSLLGFWRCLGRHLQ